MTGVTEVTDVTEVLKPEDRMLEERRPGQQKPDARTSAPQLPRFRSSNFRSSSFRSKGFRSKGFRSSVTSVTPVTFVTFG